MRRITLWALSTLSAVVLLFGYHTSTSGPTAATSTPAQSGSFASSSSATSPSTAGAGSGAGGSDDETETSPAPSSPTAGATPTTQASGSGSASTTSGTKTVAGSVAETRWGPVQVQLTIASGKITKASVLQYPQGNGRDIEINDQALPILTQETVDAQSADIDMVSGATYTSDGYIQSLQSALDKAGL